MNKSLSSTVVSMVLLLFAIISAGCTTAQAHSARRRQEFRAELSRQIEEMLRQHELLERRQSELIVHPQRSEGTSDRSALNLVMPVAGVSPEVLRSTFGERRSGGRRHMGIDIFAPRGAEVVAVTAGTIAFIGSRSLAGRCVWLQADSGESYFYAHLEAWAAGLERGRMVRAGDLLGFVGNSGNAAGASPHLHFEVHHHGTAVDPHPILTGSAVPSANVRYTATSAQ